jgi:hypothetical protein
LSNLFPLPLYYAYLKLKSKALAQMSWLRRFVVDEGEFLS